MSETDDSGARARGGKPLSLKKTETSTVKQSFSHGRSKAVVVEKKRARVPVSAGNKPPAAAEKPSLAATETRPLQPVSPARDPHRAGVVLRQLTEEEKEARSRAIAGARVEE